MRFYGIRYLFVPFPFVKIVKKLYIHPKVPILIIAAIALTSEVILVLPKYICTIPHRNIEFEFSRS